MAVQRPPERKTKDPLWGGLWESDRLDGVAWAATFIWAGLILLAEATGYVDRWSWWDGWQVFFIGVGSMVLLGTVIRILVAELRFKIIPSAIFGAVLLGIGLDEIIIWFWPVVLFVVGLLILRDTLSNRPKPH